MLFALSNLNGRHKIATCVDLDRPLRLLRWLPRLRNRFKDLEQRLVDAYATGSASKAQSPGSPSQGSGTQHGG